MAVTWETLEQAVSVCRDCRLAGGRTNTVLGEGSRSADVMFIGEGPGFEEDRQGRPFVGPAGQLLDKMLAAIDLKREDVYIANIVKCRPPSNRIPSEDEAKACMKYLRAQVYLIKPRVIVLLGATAACNTIDRGIRITKDRGVFVERNGYYMLPTYHPAALLRDAAKKADAWADFKAVRDKLKELGENA
ncbi:MAG: uracil-DNA glycosylase [Christensenellales bacterium]